MLRAQRQRLMMKCCVWKDEVFLSLFLSTRFIQRSSMTASKKMKCLVYPSMQSLVVVVRLGFFVLYFPCNKKCKPQLVDNKLIFIYRYVFFKVNLKSSGLAASLGDTQKQFSLQTPAIVGFWWCMSTSDWMCVEDLNQHLSTCRECNL